ncbi:MAG: kinase [Nanohaloarchaea archaeon SW_7_43_1]|nr:MAG: kinase [Nanohaloarchaea archaeon SW_7_43_1]
MIVALTGTPGTGKTSVARELEGFEILDLTEFVKKHGIGKQGDKEFNVDVTEMRKKLEEEIEDDQDTIIEGHLAHHFLADYCVVLRCDPEELERRLQKRDYSQEKINENIESEMLDVILTEAVGIQQNIIEIDTTDRELIETVQRIKEKLRNDETGYGRVDWTDHL